MMTTIVDTPTKSVAQPVPPPPPATIAEAGLHPDTFALYKEIAEKLSMKVRTVRTHLERMREKSGLHDRLALGLWALTFPQPS